MCNIQDFKRLTVTNGRDNSTQWLQYLQEELSAWHQWYLPRSQRLDGLTVLDLGAGCGETAQFFLNHGAAGVIAVESNPEALQLLEANFKGDARVTIVAAHVDWTKVDIEGSEWGTRIESHYAAPKLRIIKPWSSNDNTGIYSLEKSILKTSLQDMSYGAKRLLVWQGKIRRRLLHR